MLQHIEISNFILIHQLSLPVSNGMTVMTGETGAGKSILLGALGAALGGRLAAKSVLKDSSKKAVIELTIKVSESLKAEFEILDIDYAKDTVFRRELLPSGKSRCFINDTPVKAADLARFAGSFIDINSQSDSGLLHRVGQQMELIDAFANATKERSAYLQVFEKYTTIKDELRRLEELGQNDDLDYLRFVVNELKNVHIEEGEYETIEDQLLQAKSLKENLDQFHSLYGLLNKDGGALDQIYSVENALNKIIASQGSFEKYLPSLAEAVSTLTDLAKATKDSMNTGFDEGELEALKERKRSIDAMVRKHRVLTPEELMDKKSGLVEKLEKLENKEKELERLSKELVKVEADLEGKAELLHAKRMKASDTIQKAFATYLERVDLPKAKLEMTWEKVAASVHGTYKPVFMFAANPGSAMEPLHKVASGGEQSRIKLALKAVLGKHAALSTQIFDEIDTGISGSTAEKVGALMKELADNQQIITITHLPQVAAAGNTHWKVVKNQLENDTTSQVNPLNKEQRVDEIARLLSGTKVTEAAKNQAKVLLNPL